MEPFFADAMRTGFVYTSCRFHGADDVAAYFGLHRLGSKWIVVSRDEARAILIRLLRRELAHGSERLSESKAVSIASEFIERFPSHTVFSTNSRWLEPPQHDEATNSWSYAPAENATSATFDGGVVAFSDVLSGALWIEDED